MVHAVLSLVKHQFLGFAALVVAVGGYADAATGGNFILGKLNAANTTSTLQTTGNTPTLSLKVEPGVSPFEVNSAVMVDNLNAERINGRELDDLALADEVYTKKQADARYFAKTTKRTIKVVYRGVEIPAESAVIEAYAKCPAGYRLMSGGAEIFGTATAYLVATKATRRDGVDAWWGKAVNPPGIHLAGTLDVQAICTLAGKPFVP